MKKLLSLTLLICFYQLIALSQEAPSLPTQRNNEDIYAVWINGGDWEKQYLWGITDSTITFGESAYDEGKGLKTYSINDIKWIKVRKIGQIRSGVGIGVVTSALTGFIIGYSDGDDNCDPDDLCLTNLSAEAKGLAMAIGLTPIGAVAGGFLGSIKKKIKINRSHATLAEKRPELEQYLRKPAIK
jgi:hypothetical protein